MRNSDTLLGFFFVIFKRKYWIFWVFLIIFAGVFFGTFLLTPTYMAEAKIFVDFNPKQQLIVFSDLATPAEWKFRINELCQNVIVMLRSRDVAEEIVKKYELDERLKKRETEPEELRYVIRKKMGDFLEAPVNFARSRGWLEEEKKDFLADAVQNFIEDAEDIEQETSTSVISIKIWEESPELASSIANTLVKLLHEQILLVSRVEVEIAYDFVNHQLVLAKKDLTEAEDELDKFKKEHKIVLISEKQTVMIQRLDTLESELDNLRAQLAVLLEEKTPSHPEVMQLRVHIKVKEEALSRQTQEFLQLPHIEREIIRLSRVVEAYERVVNDLWGRLEELKVQRLSELGDIRVAVIDKAYISPDAEQDFPDWGLIIIISFGVALLMSIGFAFLVEYCNDTFYTVNEIEKITQLPVLGSVPKFGTVGRKGKMKDANDEKSKE